ncbi:hypothetical protein COLO4_25127 [Corchorus olitorius]|uniref:Uncharacterized protein n=1 Tax=Corchorus olitorius TaxID=93759 RepID=A0A1R3I4T1_9ROSI|nr:hypothetical protein COLO4_25127 [Corchorus olitorius]
MVGSDHNPILLDTDQRDKVEDEARVEECFLRFFQNLYSAGELDEDGSILENIPFLVSEEQNEDFIKDVTDEEIKKATFEMGIHKPQAQMATMVCFLSISGQ